MVKAMMTILLFVSAFGLRLPRISLLKANQRCNFVANINREQFEQELLEPAGGL